VQQLVSPERSSPPLTGQVALGGAQFSLPDVRDDDAAVEVVRVAAEAGVRVFDSARAYAPFGDPTHNESLLARALHGRTDVLVATKGGHFRSGPEEWDVDNSPDRLRRDVEDSLVALGVERLDLYYLHRADHPTPIARGVAALADLRDAGKIARIGISNVTVAQVDEALAVAPVAAVQNLHSAAHAESADVLRRCEQLGIPFFAYSPLRGVASGPVAARAFPRTAALATERGVSVQRLLLRGLLASSPVISVITGASRVPTAIDAAAAAIEPWDDDLAAAFSADTDSRHRQTG
jgi:pyridoxine 4-dehydrogenase